MSKSLKNQVYRKVADKVYYQVWNQIRSNYDHQLWRKVEIRNRVWNQVRDQVASVVLKFRIEIYRKVRDHE